MRGWGRRMAAAGVALVLLGACGNDDTGTVADDGGSGSASGSASHPEGSASGVAACEPVGDGGGTEVKVALDEWSVAAQPATVPAGKVTFDVENVGEEAHELVVVKAASTAELTVVEGKVDEEALPEGAFIGEVEAFPADQSCEGTFDLEPGTYILFCNIVEEHEGAPESHYEEGMVTTFTVA